MPLPFLSTLFLLFFASLLGAGAVAAAIPFFCLTSDLSGVSCTDAQKVHALHLQNLQLRTRSESRRREFYGEPCGVMAGLRLLVDRLGLLAERPTRLVCIVALQVIRRGIAGFAFWLLLLG